MTPEHKKPTARQVFDIPRWIESELSQVNLTVAVSEIIDNALDETPSGQKASILITFDARSKSITFENRNTTGMDIDKMQEFPLWGGVHQDPEKIKEHRLGGKLAIVSLLSKESGSVTLTSKPPGSTTIYQMSIENWWQRLSPDEEFEIKKIDTQETETEGYTRFDLSGVKEVPSNLTELADELGVIYGPLIRNQRLTIKLRRLPPRGAKIETTQVLPVTIPFNEALTTTRERVPTRKKGRGPRITVTWGLLDQDQKRRDETARRRFYETQRVSQIRGDSVYFYYHGRLLSVAPLSTLRIPGHTVKHIFQSFVVSVDIQEGWAPKTILKTALSASAPETKDIYQKAVSLIAADVARLAKESGTEEVPPKYKERAKNASTALATVLNEVFNNNTSLIAETFNLPTKGFVFSTEKSQRGARKAKKEPSLPGFRAAGSKAAVTPTQEPRKDERLGKKKEAWVNPIPEFDISPFPANSPEAQVSLNEETGRPVIELNYLSPSVYLALQQRGRVFLGELLRIGAMALYHEKWIRVAPQDSLAYWEGIQKDVAEFLATASKLKLI